MKTYFRVLSFAKPLEKYLIPFIIFALISSIFGALNLTLLIPMLDLLFRPDTLDSLPQSTPNFESWEKISDFTRAYLGYLLYEGTLWAGKMGALQVVCVLVLVSTVVANLFRFLYERTLELLRARLSTKLRGDIFSKIITLDLTHFSSNRKGDMITRLSMDVSEVDVAINHSIRALVKEPIVISIYFYLLFKISWQLTIFTFIFIPITGSIVAIIIKKLRKGSQEAQANLSSMMSTAEEAFGSMRIIKAFNGVGYMNHKFQGYLHRYRDVVFKLGLKRELLSPVSETTGISIVVGLILYGGSLVLSEPPALEASSFLTFIIIFAIVIKPIKEVFEIFGKLQRSLVSAERIFEVLDLQTKIVDKANASRIFEIKEKISFENIHFSYDGKTNVLQDISFEIAKGQTVALVGQSGSGKSTIADLLSRFYDPTEGHIKIDGIPLTDYRLQDLRALTGVVTQEAVLYNDTVAGNIAFGFEATQEQIQAAAQIANAHEFIIKMPEGYQTNIGERGSKLSGGQRQRISIARAVLRNPQLLILDEATSALDTESEKLVQQALEQLMQNRTALVIAHRLSTVQKADKIIVLQNGRIAEQGTHNELIKLETGIYKKLCDSQELLQ